MSKKISAFVLALTFYFSPMALYKSQAQASVTAGIGSGLAAKYIATMINPAKAGNYATILCGVLGGALILNAIVKNKKAIKDEEKKLSEQPEEMKSYQSIYAMGNVYGVKESNAKRIEAASYTMAGCFAIAAFATTPILDGWAIYLAAASGVAGVYFGQVRAKKMKSAKEEAYANAEQTRKDEDCLPGSPCACSETHNQDPEGNQACVNSYLSGLNFNGPENCVSANGQIDEACACLESNSCFNPNQLNSLLGGSSLTSTQKSIFVNSVKKLAQGKTLSSAELAKLKNQTDKQLSDLKNTLKKSTDKSHQSALANFNAGSSGAPFDQNAVASVSNSDATKNDSTASIASQSNSGSIKVRGDKRSASNSGNSLNLFGDFNAGSERNLASIQVQDQNQFGKPQSYNQFDLDTIFKKVSKRYETTVQKDKINRGDASAM